MTEVISAEEEEKSGRAKALMQRYRDTVAANEKLLERATATMEDADSVAFVQSSADVLDKVRAAVASCPSETLDPEDESLSHYQYDFSRQYRVLVTLDFQTGQNTLDSGQNTLDSGQNTLDSGQNTLDSVSKMTCPDMLQYHPGPVGVDPDMLQYHPGPVGVDPDMLQYHPGPVGVDPDMLQYHPVPVGVDPDMLQYHPGPVGVDPDMLQYHPRPVGVDSDMLQYHPGPVGVDPE
uniref:COS domain-containing protein n=1 Tax=Knipowitschia caucasica TaxID=637954 RepID=A0AAV2JHS4_KNICA